MPTLRTLTTFFLFFLCASLAWADHELRTLDGKTVKGKVVGISDTEITLQVDGNDVSTPLSQVLALDIRPVAKTPPDLNYTRVRLLDDSVLRCNQVVFKGKDLEVTMLSGQAAKIPLSSLVSLVRDAQDPQMIARWDKVAAVKVKRDRLVILRDGELNTLEGTFGDADAEGKNIQFRREGAEVLPIPLERLHGMLFYRSESPAEAPVCMVVDTQGNTLAASKLSVEGEVFKLTTPSGAKIDFNEKALAKIDYNLGKLTYLSDMEPAKVPVERIFGWPPHYVRDKFLAGSEGVARYEAVCLGAAPVLKALWMHSYTELEYDLAGKYKDFKADLGVDLRVGSASQAKVTIECDGLKVFSETVNAKAPRALSLNVRDVRRLRIIVSSSDPQNVLGTGDHATLANARVSQ